MRRRVPALTFLLTVVAAVAISAGGAGIASASAPKKHHKPAHRVKGPLSGTWTGQYGGTFSGTFTLTWTEYGSSVKGTIVLSPGGTDTCNGTVTGKTIKFGTVGGPDITYTGSVAGDSMSGNYNTPRGGGSWSATKKK